LLTRLLRLVRTGLEATARLWPPIQAVFAYVHRAAHVLANPAGEGSAGVRETYQALLAEWQAEPTEPFGPLAPAVARFQKVTASYWPGLFYCYDLAELPRTNNDLEHYFGTARHLERRVTGRKAASPALVVRGAVRVVAAVATRLEAVETRNAAALRPRDVAAWWALRRQVELRHHARRAQARFRRDPQTYLATLEQSLLKPALPP
jgi:hypothetical protein